MADYKPNDEQQAVLDDVARGTGNTIVSARAGTGKTRTILAALQHVPEHERRQTVLVAFNADIAKVLKTRAPSGVKVKTMHALGLCACSKAFGRVEVDKDRGRRIAMQVCGADRDSRMREWGYALHRVASFCKGVLATNEQKVGRVIDRLQPDHSVEPYEAMRCVTCRRWSPVMSDDVCGHAGCKGKLVRETRDDRPEFIRQVLECLKRATYDETEGETAQERAYPRTVDFDDMCFLPVKMGLKMPKYGRVFCDECQDLNAVQHKLVVGSLQRDGRFCGIGDPRQSIYQFRGASEESMGLMRDELDAKELPMSMTYRCGQAIVREAQRYVPDFRAAPGQHEGEVVDNVPVERMLKEAAPGDFILSRVNAPLLGLCLGFLKERRRANIKGKDIGARLNAIIRRAKAGSIEELVTWVNAWAKREIEKAVQNGDAADIVSDTHACLSCMIEGARDVYGVQGRIAEMFDDEDDDTRITLSTAHRAKGMERNCVWMLRDTFRPERSKAETNLAYVATTRAIHTLFIVRGQVPT